MNRSEKIVALDYPPYETTRPGHGERIPRDYADWWAYLAAPGSRFPAARTAPIPLPRPAVASHPAAFASDERRTA